eukprot:TRINITY_DN9717_c0_g2_i1.p1 TRINITY_DN9717_c0_g2~~TRINITY_DN9717_c0_g2_i1.p1  ORF type:complete len:824 (-),score=168.04 TRINITY_DN9717_c0_g2_i1:843-3314(-)
MEDPLNIGNSVGTVVAVPLARQPSTKQKLTRQGTRTQTQTDKKGDDKKAQKLAKCKAKLEALDKSASNPKDLLARYVPLYAKYESQIQSILAEEKGGSGGGPVVEAVEQSAETGMPRGLTGKVIPTASGVAFKPDVLWQPAHLQHIISIIQNAEKNGFKVIPTGCYWSNSVPSSTNQWAIDMTKLSKVPRKGQQFLSGEEKEILKESVSLDTLFQVEAGVNLEEMNEALSEAQLALPHLPSFQSVTIAGAVTSGSHGSGRYFPSLGDFVKSMDVVVHSGKVFRVEPTEGITDPEKFKVKHPEYAGLIQNDLYFKSLLVSLGTMGIIYSYIFKVEKKYWLRESTLICPWTKLSKLLLKEKLWSESKPKDAVSVLINPYGARNSVVSFYKYVHKDPGGSGSTEKRKNISNVLAYKSPNAAGTTESLLRLFSSHTPELLDLIVKGLGEKTNADLGYKILNSNTTDEILKDCYIIQIGFPLEPIQNLLSQIEKTFALIEYLRSDFGYLSVPMELTFVDKSSAFLAQSCSGAMCMIEIRTLKEMKNSLGFIKRIEEELTKNGGIPHWSLRFLPVNKEKIRDHYPQIEDWYKVYTNLNGTKMTFSSPLIDQMYYEKVYPISSSGPFKADTKDFKRRELVRYNPQDLHREFPHIAKGSYGVVFKGKVPDVPHTVAIKDMDITDSNVIEDWKKELVVMNQNQSPYIVEVYGYTNNSQIVTIVMEFMSRGDLFTLLHKTKEPLSILQRLRMSRHCALGIALLHQHNVIHRDVKSLNILLTEDFSCKLTDFGCAKLISDKQAVNTINSGTPLWMAPEVKSGHKYGLEADIYSN